MRGNISPADRANNSLHGFMNCMRDKFELAS